MHVSDVVLQSLASDVFWLAVLVLVIICFRQQISSLLNSLGSFKVAGASFELKSREATLESYVILTNIIVEVLTDRDIAIKFGYLLSDVSIRQLSRFALTYAKNVPDDVKQEELLKNIAVIISERGDSDSARVFYDALLKENPRDIDILNLKGLALGQTGSRRELLEAEVIFDELVDRRPGSGSIRFNRALTKAQLGKSEDAIADLNGCFTLGYWKQNPNMLSSPVFTSLASDEAFQEIQKRLAGLMRPHGE